MTLSLDARQRALLQHMGIRLDFLPPVASAVAAPVAEATLKPPTTEPGPRADVSQADWERLQHSVSQCTACGLCQTRKQTVFGTGTRPDAAAAGVDLMIVGEAPGEHEDKQGLPFVGAAGQLLDQMLTALGLSRQAEGGPQGTVFIANVLKCRPPDNRNPSPQEMAQCLPFLQRQIELARPKVLLALGRFGAQALLSEQLPNVEQTPLGKLRLSTHQYRGTPLVVTFHPAYLLRNPVAKAQVWADLCLAHSMLPQPEQA
jgi:DNA polymerase